MHFIGGTADTEEKVLMFRYQFFSKIFGCVGLFCLFTTLVSPFWLVSVQPDSPINVGLWSICKNRTCNNLVGNTRILLLSRTFMSFSTICGLMAVVCTFLTDFSLKHSKWPLITNIFTGIISLVIMLLYGLSLKATGPLGHPAPSTTKPIYISWSFVMGCFASFLFLLNGLLFIMIRLEEVSHQPCSPQENQESKSDHTELT